MMDKKENRNEIKQLRLRLSLTAESNSRGNFI
jgi:hypothetical protein